MPMPMPAPETQEEPMEDEAGGSSVKLPAGTKIVPREPADEKPMLNKADEPTKAKKEPVEADRKA
jgi:hypothetical protein